MNRAIQHFERKGVGNHTTHMQSEFDPPTAPISYWHELMRQVSTTITYLSIQQYKQNMRNRNLLYICCNMSLYQD